jgi:DNA sulfur modification protein DndB
MEEELQTGNVTVKEHNTYEQASNAAFSEAANTGGFTFPVVLFRQGQRRFLSGAFPIGFVESRLFSRSAQKESTIKSAMGTMNRPKDPKHIKTIAKYLKENVSGNFIVPPLALNAQEPVNVHTIATGSEFKAAYLVIPMGVNLSITDGQHRVEGIIQALNELDEQSREKLRKASIAVMVACEHDLKQIHQDFADCSKTKALPASLLSLYDTRNPGNRLVFDIEERCPLFTGKIDSTSKTLSKKSSYLFLANQLRQLVKHLLLEANTPDAEFERRARDLITAKGYETYLKNYVDYINYVTEKIPVLRQISEIAVDSPQRAQIPKYREAGWICLTATGLNVIGSLGHQFMTNKVDNWRDFVERFAEVDWKRTADLWQGNIIVDDRMNTQTMPIRRAVLELKKKIGFDEELFENQDYLRRI